MPTHQPPQWRMDIKDATEADFVVFRCLDWPLANHGAVICDDGWRRHFI